MCCGDDDESIHSLEHVIRVHEFEPLFLRSHLAFGHDRHKWPGVSASAPGGDEHSLDKTAPLLLKTCGESPHHTEAAHLLRKAAESHIGDGLQRDK